VTFGLSVIIQNLLQETFTADTRSLQAGDLARRGFEVAGISIGILPLLSASVAVLLFAITHLLVARTHFGRQSRAIADDPATARLIGVDDRNFFAIVTGFVFAVIAIASVLYAMRAPFSPSAGPERLLYSFEAVVLGGLGSLWGTLLGGIIVGVAQSIGAQFDAGWQLLAGHLVFLIVFLLRPQGLFPK
jgi:branched-chain amino acid transport system permease protein